jgi:transcriptional regulator with XRE-family HTH domain
MNNEPGASEMDDPFSMEAARVVQILAHLVKTRQVSVRSLEKKMGVGDSVFSKVLKGKITLQVRHILMICTALEIEWKDFFATAYAGGTSLTSDEALPQDALEERLIALLTRLGVLPLAVPPKAPPSADDH